MCNNEHQQCYNSLFHFEAKDLLKVCHHAVENAHPHVYISTERAQLNSKFSCFNPRILIQSQLQFFTLSWQATVNSTARASQPIWCN